MKTKLTFIPCEVCVLRFEKSDVIQTSGAKESIDWDEDMSSGMLE